MAQEKTQGKTQEKKKGDSKISVVAAIASNVLVAIVKFIAAFISGSTAMVSEAIHSLVDCLNGILVLLGMKLSKKKPDFLHPFGYGKELYFWTLVVGLLVFLLGGCLSAYQGIKGWTALDTGWYERGDTLMNYIVLIAGVIIEGSSLIIAVRQFNRARGSLGPRDFIRETKDPTLYTVVLEDSAAEIGLFACLASTIICDTTGFYYFDPAASFFIALLLFVVSFILLRETKSLLVGEGMMRQSVDEIQEIVESDERIFQCGGIQTLYMGPHQLIVALNAEFVDNLSAREVRRTVDDLEAKIKARYPQTFSVFIEAESGAEALEQHQRQQTWEDEYEEQYIEDEQPDW